ncbi:MAG: glycosyltransferase family 1 protein [Chitinophagaceae bacterium]|nr:MAG: glycosyltransferase family 1 protein [Chitinophagaceae bacterium]
MKKIIRITTVPLALKSLLAGQMNFMEQNGFEVVMISAEGPELADVLKNEKCRHIVVPMTRQITPWQDLKCLFQLVKIIRREKPAIVHSHTPKAGLLGMLASRIAGVPVRIHTVAGLPLMVETGFKLRLLKFIEKLTYAAANHVWPNGASMEKFILDEKLCPPEKVKIIGKGSSNGVNTQKFNPEILNPEIVERIKQTIGYNSRYHYLLFTGRLVLDKGIIELVTVFEAIQKDNPNLRLVLTGNFERSLDPLPPHIENAILHNPAIIHVAWTDHVEYYMALANFFVFPSYREGFPNVLLQASLMRLPILCSDIPGNIDIVSHRKTGLLFKNQQVVSLQEELSWAIAHPAAMKSMAEDQYHFISNNFPREVVWKAMLQEYNNLLKA